MYYEFDSDLKYARNSVCPLCNAEAFFTSDPRLDAILIVCPSCGKFRCADEALDLLVHLPLGGEAGKHKVSHAMRTAAERAIGKRDNSLFPIYSRIDFESKLNQPDSLVREKLETLLQHLGKISKFPGDLAEFDATHDYTIIGAKHSEEANFYLRTLSEQGFLSDVKPYIGSENSRFRISATGWLEIERLSQTGKDSHIAFIAMWFDESRRSFERAITEAIEDTGYKPIRIDRTEHLNRIDDEIIRRIRQSKFLVADLTGQRNGVYFEAGFMMGLGRPVIWLCEREGLSKVHFDIRQYNTIDYADAGELKKRLIARIGANLGEGPLHNPGDAI